MTKRQRIGLTLLASAVMYLGVPGFAPAQEFTTGPSVQAEIAGGGGAVWLSDQVNVEVYADPYFTPKIVKAVRDVEAALPVKGPRFRIRTHAQAADCLKVRRKDYKGPTITFCQRDSMGASGSTVLRAQHHAVKDDRAWIELMAEGQEDYDQNTACHEMMHAVSYVNDNEGIRPGSCVQGIDPEPGPWDKAFLQQAYQRHDSKASKKRHERRRDHREGRRNGKQGR